MFLFHTECAEMNQICHIFTQANQQMPLCLIGSCCLWRWSQSEPGTKTQLDRGVHTFKLSSAGSRPAAASLDWSSALLLLLLATTDWQRKRCYRAAQRSPAVKWQLRRKAAAQSMRCQPPVTRSHHRPSAEANKAIPERVTFNLLLRRLEAHKAIDCPRFGLMSGSSRWLTRLNIALIWAERFVGKLVWKGLITGCVWTGSFNWLSSVDTRSLLSEPWCC